MTTSVVISRISVRWGLYRPNYIEHLHSSPFPPEVSLLVQSNTRRAFCSEPEQPEPTANAAARRGDAEPGPAAPRELHPEVPSQKKAKLWNILDIIVIFRISRRRPRSEKLGSISEYIRRVTKSLTLPTNQFNKCNEFYPFF